MAGRALLAVLLTIGFYALAIVVILALLAVPYLEWTALHRVNIRITLFCLVGALVIFYAVLPRIEHFRAPGPQATPATHPRLFEELTAIANHVGQRLPQEVYLAQNINAGVRERGGIIGFGGRRVMELGIPLLRILRISEFRAVLAHEFGHYRGGHTRLAPWIYKTREAIIRTVVHLSGHSAVVMWPFLQYARIFLMITQEISRQQEFEADALAAHTGGARASIAGLRAVHGASIAYACYLRENTPAYAEWLGGPPPDDEFMKFMRLPRIGEAIRNGLEEELANPQIDPYDSHPPLAARIAALEKLPPGNDPSQEPLAVSLLEPIASGGAATVAAETPLRGALPWEDAGAYGEQFRWEDELRRNFHILRGWTIGSLPDLVPSLGKVGGRLGTRWVADENVARAGRGLLVAALGMALLRAGWTIEASPAGTAVLRKGDATVDPAQEIDGLADGTTAAAVWRAKWTGLNASALRLDALRDVA